MPPATYTEAPALRDERISKHLAKSREYWLKCPSYLADGDLCQAGEKAWGAVAQMTKAVATHRGWRHFLNAELLAAVREIADEANDSNHLRESILIVRSMHPYSYETYLDRTTVESGLVRAETLLETLWELLPARHTGGASFGKWLADALRSVDK